jgi:hypothetical protein
MRISSCHSQLVWRWKIYLYKFYKSLFRRLGLYKNIPNHTHKIFLPSAKKKKAGKVRFPLQVLWLINRRVSWRQFTRNSPKSSFTDVKFRADSFAPNFMFHYCRLRLHNLFPTLVTCSFWSSCSSRCHLRNIMTYNVSCNSYHLAKLHALR